MSWLLAQLEGGGNERILDGYRFPLLAGLVAMIVAWVVTPLVKKLAIRYGAIDDPTIDDRRVHREPTPRWGGIAIYVGIVVSLLVVLPFAYPSVPFANYLIGILIAGGFIVVMGALDDLKQFSAKIQLGYILVAAILIQFVKGGAGVVQIQGITPFWDANSQWIEFGWAAIPLTAMYIFVVTKTMDTIDGIDGLAAGIASISAGTLSLIAVHSGQPRVALVCGAVAGAALGFLRHNYNPARIFMGTGGAQLFGFMLACLSIVGAVKTAAAIALIVPILAFGVPVFDAFFVITRRLLHRQPITQADKRHLHHTLMSRGLNQRQTVWVLYIVAMSLGGLLILAVKLSG